MSSYHSFNIQRSIRCHPISNAVLRRTSSPHLIPHISIRHLHRFQNNTQQHFPTLSSTTQQITPQQHNKPANSPPWLITHSNTDAQIPNPMVIFTYPTSVCILNPPSSAPSTGVCGSPPSLPHPPVTHIHIHIHIHIHPSIHPPKQPTPPHGAHI
ncbi:hypothetical protein P153DRAFT_83760 [Dothidotthia symphoricarpi CBS 119687]|uniref:Uncharacterized protein n=1 Tax=Dothidotthia symphoricarpi CBS 119687 TaxID=1392245 RepID=A0A6A6A5Z2_9PLEO|nr:uncharacterized protein P153DRAFT_83760 [Dothidotthia symphoricarpi CBS 119687]KAF2126031.1 hypothetical protein P153DRAFT_83760 [Dothidotthia symphoricarpi CBS 119687]